MNRFTGKKVLVTGAGGFIGSHLAERLVGAGATVRAMTHYNALGTNGWLDYSSLRKDIDIFRGDICDRDCVREAMKGQEIVFHLAAVIAIPYSYHAPGSYVQTNIAGTLNVLQSAREEGVSRVILTSTSEVYGTAQYVPIDEGHPLQAQSPYAASKIAADKLGESFHLSFGLPVVTVRPFNTFGPRQSDRAVIPSIITQCLTGETVRLGNVHPTRDFNFVDNTVEGFCLAATATDAIGRVLNLGSGREISICELTTLIGRLLHREVKIESESLRVRPEKSEVERLIANSSEATRLLGWKPAVELEDGLRLTIDWMRENKYRYQTDVYAL
jgi:NAD dependent epimerase/dehydratase